MYEVEEEDRRLITHAGLVIGNSLLMVAEAQVAEELIAGETGTAGRRVVSGLPGGAGRRRDVTLARPEELGAEITRPARMNPTVGRGDGDPFGRRWLVQIGSA